MSTTQDNRLLAIYTPLKKDFLLLEQISGTEGISELYHFDVELLHEEDDPGSKPTIVAPESIIGQGVTVTISQKDGTLREITGIVNRFSQGARDARFSFYSATIVPHVWVLTQKFQSRIFQNISVPDILRRVFSDFEVSWKIQGSQNKRNYCVQYRETDFDFACRLMEEEGFYYFFEHHEGKHKMVITDIPQSPTDCPSKEKIPYFIDITSTDQDFITSINVWRVDNKLQTGKVTFWDYNFQLPAKRLEQSEESVFSVGENRQMELYDYPGGYARKYDGISGSGGDQASQLALSIRTSNRASRQK